MQRPIKYWNMLPCEVREATSVNDFKARLENHKQVNLGSDGMNGYWCLSGYWSYSRIQVLDME